MVCGNNEEFLEQKVLVKNDTSHVILMNVKLDSNVNEFAEDCRLEKRVQVLEVQDSNGNKCITPQPINITYCNGSCPSFDSPQVTFIKADGSRVEATREHLCECCTGTGYTETTSVICPGNVMRTIELQQFTKCECITCEGKYNTQVNTIPKNTCINPF